MRLALLAILVVIALMLASSSWGSEVEKPTTVIAPEKCVTSQCHPKIQASAVVHGPVGSGTCDACHELTDAKAHKFKASREKEALCTYCHEFDVSAMPVIHKPVIEGECLGCHDPHGGRDATLTRENSMAELCGRCHESITMDRKVVHTPVAKGACTSCHPPHASKFPKLLDALNSDLCLRCHTDFAARMMNVKSRHKAMEKGCDKCHDVHGSNLANMVIKPAPDLCITCHEKVKERATTAKYRHSVVMNDDACQTCHTPHGSDQPKLMIDQPVVICMKCHKDAIKREGQPTIAAVPEVIDPHTQKHGPIKEGLCSGCHDVHGSDQPAMLAKVYNKTFYQRFSPEHYELCFSCHDAKLVSEEQTSQSTAFRNGTRNLHYIHANTGDRDKSCSVCHSSHGSLNSRILRDRVVFGTWNMPIRYKKTPTGGSCYPGCHPTWAYDRVHPATRPTTAPTQPVKIAIARAEIEKPRRIQWAGRTISHDEVRVPDAKDPTILLFLGGELDQAKQSIDAIEQVRGDSLPARAIVLLCGPGAQSAEHEMLVPKTWETVADPDFAISREFNVVGWPMTMIVGTDGAEIIRIGGGAEALDARLHPYLELANKKIDAAALDARLSSHAASTPKTTKQMRDLQTARHLIESGKPAAACEILNELLKSEPEDVPLRVTMIQALTQSNRGLDALDMLNSLPADAMSLDERDLLRAKNQITLMRWDEAQRILTQTLARNPDCSEAHFIMGQIYEHANDWQHAAQEYRAMRAKQLPALNVAPAK